MWVRGLKHRTEEVKGKEDFVAPYVGAWIETKLERVLKSRLFVAPYVGAWIETYL